MSSEKTACIFLLVFMIISFSTFGFCAEEMNRTSTSQQCANQVSNLDVPAKQEIPVRSELERGGSAFFQCNMHMMDIATPARCVQDILNEEQLKKTDTNAFKLGVYFRGWIDMDYYKKILRTSGSNIIGTEVSDYISLFSSYRSLQNQLNVSDEELCEAFGLKYDIVKLNIDNAVREFQY